MSNTRISEPLNNLTLITGGARSGKSRFAETLASSSTNPVVYLATMEHVESDAESRIRIKRHRERRPSDWTTVEQAHDVHTIVDKLDDGNITCILDCLSLYVSNVVLANFDGTAINAEKMEVAVFNAIEALIESIAAKSKIQFLVVTNEVGWGIVPENGLARIYRDLLGVANQSFAESAANVYLSCVGLQIALKQDASRALL